MTVLEGINLSTDYLEKKGIESPRLNAELLLASVLKCKRLELYLAFDKPLKKEEVDQYREYLKRRGNFEPLQYITGEVEFYGFPFIVNSSVLIPRPETETLIETLTNIFEKDAELDVLDIGTGSGILAISIAKLFPKSHIIATDISQAAIDVASKNAELNSVNDRVEFINNDILSGLDEFLNRFDLVVSNPPYVSVEEYKELQPEILKFEPRQAITDDADGLTFYRMISELAATKLLKKGGALYFEVGKGQWKDVSDILSNQGFLDVTFQKDLIDVERVVYGVKS